MNNVIYRGLIINGLRHDGLDQILLTEEANGFACWLKTSSDQPQLIWYRRVDRNDAIELAVLEAQSRRHGAKTNQLSDVIDDNGSMLLKKQAW